MAGETSRENGKKGGRPFGSKNKTTLEKQAALERFQERVRSVVDPLFDYQLTLARGQTFLYRIDKEEIGKGKYRKLKPVLVTNQQEIENYLEGLVEEGDMEDDTDPAAAYYFLTTKEPSNFAIDSLLDRTFGKAAYAEPIETKLTIEDGDIRAMIAKLPPKERKQYHALLAKLVASVRRGAGESGKGAVK